MLRVEFKTSDFSKTGVKRLKKKTPAIISYVEPGSIAHQLNIKVGDKLLEINNYPLRDIIDYQMLSQEDNIILKIENQQGEIWEFEIEKDYNEAIGISFTEECFDGMLKCKNKCSFCFLKGLPKGLRKSLYVKDDDYRHSFLYGNYITLTNVEWNELNRIAKLKLSPLYISIHTTNPSLRVQMMNNKNAGDIYKKIKYLADNQIEIHAQAVLCPNINDGKELDKTIEDLAALWPQIKSFAVVPVGLTSFNFGVEDFLRPYTKIESNNVIVQIQHWQEKLNKQIGSRFVFASDEFYLLADKEVPKEEEYEGYPQLENGVGLVRSFRNDFNNEYTKRLSEGFNVKQNLVIATGELASPILKDLFVKHDINIRILTVKNRFFGYPVTVTGLLTGYDLVKELKNKVSSEETVVISSIMLKQGEDIFLDDMKLLDVEEQIGTNIKILPNNGSDLAHFLTGGGC